jgi:hypothetical protein
MVYISFSVAQHDVTHHPAYQPELLSSRTVSTTYYYYYYYYCLLTCIFWVVTLCVLLGDYQRFRGTYWLCVNSEDGDVTFLRNDDIYLRVHTASQPIRTTSTNSQSREPQMLDLPNLHAAKI